MIHLCSSLLPFLFNMYVPAHLGNLPDCSNTHVVAVDDVVIDNITFGTRLEIIIDSRVEGHLSFYSTIYEIIMLQIFAIILFSNSLILLLLFSHFLLLFLYYSQFIAVAIL